MQWHENFVKKYKNDFERFIWLTVKKYNCDKYSEMYFQNIHIEIKLIVTDDDYEF